MKKLPTAFLAAAALAVLATLGLRAADDKNVARFADSSDNIPPKGFTALFNGKDLTNWQGLIDIKQRAKFSPEELVVKQKEANDKIMPHWTIQDGVLTYDGKANSLQTVKDYADFELYADWKIEEKGDSGIYLRGCPQVQIWDSDRTPGAKGEDKSSGSGGLWNNTRLREGKIPLKKADKPVGEWNTFHIFMNGDKVTVFLNDILVVDHATMENIWEKDAPVPAKGPIELQHHGDKLWFKNIYIKELNVEPKP